MKFIILLILVLSSTQVTTGEISWIDTGTRLPSGCYGFTSLFDGNDTIYTIGGWTGTESTSGQVLQYTVSTGAIEFHGYFLPVYSGQALLFNDDIFYFGGRSTSGQYSSAIYKYSISTQNYVHINDLPVAMYSFASAWDPDQQRFFMFGGTSSVGSMDHILQYDPSSNQVRNVGILPNASYEATAVWTDHYAFIFGGSPRYDMLRFDPATRNVMKLAKGLPNPIFSPCSIFANNRHVYIVNWSDMMRFDPDAEQAVQVQTDDNWPVSMMFPGIAYVSELNRIYIFGGWGYFGGQSGDRFMDEISYLDLDQDRLGASRGNNQITLYLLSIGIPLFAVLLLTTFCWYRYRNSHDRQRIQTVGVAKVEDDTAWDQPTGVGLNDQEIEEFESGVPKLNYCLLQDPFISRGNVIYQPYNRLFELQEDAVRVDRAHVLGSGQFGVVLKGELVATGTPVAIKTIKFANRSSKHYVKALLGELKILIYLGRHPHIVNLIGACTAQLRKGSVLICVEFCQLGDMETYLRVGKSSFNNKTPSHYKSWQDADPFNIHDLFHWSWQIANAMLYMAERKVIHGDLATRNVLLADRKCAKVTDFGLAKQLYN